MSDQWEANFTARPGCTLFGLLLVLVLIFAGIGVVTWVINIASQPGRVASRTLDADNMIANYEWFRQQYRDIESFGARIDLAKSARDGFMRDAGPRPSWSPEDRYRYAQLNDNLTGLQAQRARMIETYNARASMLNRRLFQGADVPAYIEQPPAVE